MNNNFNFNDWFATVIPAAQDLVRNTVRDWLVENEFNTLGALQLLEKSDMPVDWPPGRKSLICASRPDAQGNHDVLRFRTLMNIIL